MSLRDTPADNLRALKNWHNRNHHAASWASCVHSPCNVTTPTFRRQWDTGAN